MTGPRESISRTCISFRSSQLDGAKGLSRLSGAPLAELTRRAVDAFLLDASPWLRARVTKLRVQQVRVRASAFTANP